MCSYRLFSRYPRHRKHTRYFQKFLHCIKHLLVLHLISYLLVSWKKILGDAQAESNIFLQLTNIYDIRCRKTNKCFFIPSKQSFSKGRPITSTINWFEREGLIPIRNTPINYTITINNEDFLLHHLQT